MKFIVPLAALAATPLSLAAVSPQPWVVPDQSFSIAAIKRDAGPAPTATTFDSQLHAPTTTRHSAHGTGTGHHPHPSGCHHPHSRNGTAAHHHSSDCRPHHHFSGFFPFDHPHTRNGTSTHHHPSGTGHVMARAAPAFPTLTMKTPGSPIVITEVAPDVSATFKLSTKTVLATAQAKRFPANASPIVITESSPSVPATYSASQASPASTTQANSVKAGSSATASTTQIVTVTASQASSASTTQANSIKAGSPATAPTTQIVTVTAEASVTVSSTKTVIVTVQPSGPPPSGTSEPSALITTFANSVTIATTNPAPASTSAVPNSSAHKVSTRLHRRDLSAEDTGRVLMVVVIVLLFVGMVVGCCLDPRCRYGWAWRKETKNIQKHKGLRDLELGRGVSSC